MSVSEDARNMLQRVFDNLRDGMISVGDALDRNVKDQVNGFVVNIGDIATYGKSGDEISKALSEAVSGQADRLAYAVFGDIVKAYGKMNEGYFQTLNRLITDKAVVEQTLKNIGLPSLTGDKIKTSESLINLSGSTSNFVSQVNSFFDKFYSDDQKAALNKSKATELFEYLNLTLPTTSDALVSLVKGLDLTTEAGSTAFNAITSNTDLLKSYYDTIGSSSDAVTKATADIKAFIDELTGILQGTSINATTNSSALYASTYAKALVGDKESIANIVNVSKTYLSDKKATSTSLEDYQRSVAGVASDLTALKLPAFDVGTNYVPRDMIAQIHQGEMIVPKAFNPIAAGKAFSQNAQPDNGLIRELLNEVKALREENKQLQVGLLNESRKQAKTLQKWDVDGLPTQEVVA